MTRIYVKEPHTAWEEYFPNKKAWLDGGKIFWKYVHEKRYEEYVCVPNMYYYEMFENMGEPYARYYAFLHHQYEIIYEE